MLKATLTEMVTMLRAECGYALSASQGLNTLETLKYVIRRTEYELWVAFDWKPLIIRAELPTTAHQYLYDWPAEMGFDQTREVYWTQSDTFTDPLVKGICEEHIQVGGANSTEGSPQEWDFFSGKIRIWPTPNVVGTLRLKGQKPLNELVDEDDVCTLDATMIVLFAAAEVLERAGAKDAPGKMQKAQRHLSKIRGDQQKVKISTFGADRRAPHAAGGSVIRIV